MSVILNTIQILVYNLLIAWEKEINNMYECELVSDYIVDYIKSKIENPIEYLNGNRKDWINQPTIDKIDFLRDKFTTIETPFLKDVYLKFLIHEALISKEGDHQKLKEWIVQDWGGIKTHKDFDTLSIAMAKNSLDRISSWSKIASFQDIKTKIIYDSRVIYTLNWIIYKYNKETDNASKYLFQPSGRNKLLTLLPVDSIINFDNIKSLQIDQKGDKIFGDIYKEQGECYSYACNLIQEINVKLFEQEAVEIPGIGTILAKDFPFFTEMLLFQMADNIIFKDIKESIQISIGK